MYFTFLEERKSVIEQLKVLLQPAGLSLSEEIYEKLRQYHTLLLDWNTRMDLTNVEDRKSVV